MKLWQKTNTTLSTLIEAFTVGKDKEFDLRLAAYDVEATSAHVQMLGECGLLTSAEVKQVVTGLKEIGKDVEKGTFQIEEGVEDIHSQIELLLTRKMGDVGKKIHAGRSRNDQVAVAIKLFLRSELQEIKKEMLELFEILQQQSERFKNKLLPGYTHLQVAMPSSAGLWLGAYAESLVDDMELLAAAYSVVNKNPLGSGAGYGTSFPIQRKTTTRLLQFAHLNWNSIYAQMTRGKSEKITAMAMSSVANTLARLSMDVCLYLNQNFSFIAFPDALTTGSSIMPHKKNPDVFELIRAHCNRIQALPNELSLLLTNLPSGYHRDVQLTKEILFPALTQLHACLQIAGLMLKELQVKDHLLENNTYRYIYSVEAVNERVNQGIPFRQAYQEVGDQIEKGEFTFDPQKALHHSHEGSIGNLCTQEIKSLMQEVLGKFSI